MMMQQQQQQQPQQQQHPNENDAPTVLLARATDSSTARWTTTTTIVGDRSKSAGDRRGRTVRSWCSHKSQGNSQNKLHVRSSGSLSPRHNKHDRYYHVRMSPLVVLLLTTASSVLSHWAGRWLGHHRRPEWAATIRASSSSNTIATSTTTGGSSASEVHHWYYAGSCTTPRSTTTTTTTTPRSTSITTAGQTGPSQRRDANGSPQHAPLVKVRTTTTTTTTTTTCTMNTSSTNASCGCDDDGTTGQRHPHDSDYEDVLGYKNFAKNQVLAEERGSLRDGQMNVPSNDGKGQAPSPNGVPASRRQRGQASAVYHEALVHAAMLVHPDPKRVAILGGGSGDDGAILREVLKHDTVERVIMVMMETDDERWRELPHATLDWNSDCSDLVGSANSCFDDPRVTIIMIADSSIVWLMKHFGNETKSSSAFGGVAPFDVIIMGGISPESVLEFSALHYGETNLVIKTFHRALSEQGVLVTHIGEAANLSDAVGAPLPPTRKAAAPVLHHDFIEGLAEAGFESIFEYTESHGRCVLAPWTFVVALKDAHTRARWFHSEAHVQLDLLRRSRRLKDNDKELPFRFFDGATFMTYQFPSRIAEETWCRNNAGKCANGHGFDPSKPDRNESSYRVARSSVANGGRGVFALEDIPKDSYMGNEECVNGMFVPPNTFEIMDEFDQSALSDATAFWTTVYEVFIEGYGWEMAYYGNHAAGIETSLMTFVNHGCNKTYSIGVPTDVSELTVDLTTLAEQSFFIDTNEPFHPYEERHFPAWDCSGFKALRDIKAGEEILDNYMVMGGQDGTEMYGFIAELKSMCSGGIGSVTQYERQREKRERLGESERRNEATR